MNLICAVSSTNKTTTIDLMVFMVSGMDFAVGFVAASDSDRQEYWGSHASSAELG
jgi:hypothetical protein